ncbi:MAG: hypothetical protein H6719_31490 [Sandaracinaceae bacterium]|nr:hypothetical protein [Sandaracinaceae bacterium]
MGRYLVAVMLALAPVVARAQTDSVPVRARARHDAVLSWSPRHRLDTSTDPVGLEQQLWRRVDTLPLYHRVSLDASGLLEGKVSLHLAGWGALDLLADSSGAIAAGDIAIGYVEVDLEPVRLWAGRRFIAWGPPGGLHVDGGGVSARTSFGLVAEAFGGRPVTPTRISLLGPEASFDGAAASWGARLAYTDAGTFAASAGYAETWSHGILESRVVDVAAYWDPGDLRIEAGGKIDAASFGLAQARAGATYRVVRELSVDADYMHVEPGRWIPPWSILSVFDTSTFDEAGAGATLRPIRALAIRAEGAARVYSSASNAYQADEARVGYRVELTGRVLPNPGDGPRVRVLVSRRDDGTMGYTLITAGAAFDPFQHVVMTVDGAFAIDDQGGRESAIGRASVDFTGLADWSIGLTVALARTPIAAAEARGMLRIQWSPEVGR